jgi:hypothetical protein
MSGRPPRRRERLFLILADKRVELHNLRLANEGGLKNQQRIGQGDGELQSPARSDKITFEAEAILPHREFRVETSTGRSFKVRGVSRDRDARTLSFRYSAHADHETWRPTRD